MPAPKAGEEGGPRMVMIKKSVTDGGGDAATGGGGPKVDVEIGDGGGEWKMDMGDMKRFMPEFEPDIRGLLAWPDGRIWVVTSERDDDTMHVDEWSMDGRYRKRFELPGYDTVAVGSDGALYAVEHDADDFPIVHRLDVTARH